MSERQTAIPSRQPSATSADDTVLPFEVKALDLRGRVVRLGPAVDTILRAHDYPAPVAKLLGEAVVLAMTKRTPWASAILTGAWFLIVTVGTLATIISYVVEGGLASSSGVLMASGILTLGLFFIFSGLVTVVMAYRMENSRLAVLQQEFEDVVTGRAAATR